MLRQLAASARGILAQLPQSSSIPSLVSDMSLRQVQPLTTLLNFRRTISDGGGATQQPSEAAVQASPEAAGAAPPPPWTPTRLLEKRKVLTKRMGHMLEVLEKEKEMEAKATTQHPDFGPGDFLELKLSVPENKRRTTLFKGICIARRNRGWRTTFTLRNFIGNSGGIERSFPL